MINDQLRELRVRLDQMERIALAIPTKYWPDAFEAVLEGCEIMVGIAERELDQEFSTKDRPKRPGPHRSRPSLWSDADGIEPARGLRRSVHVLFDDSDTSRPVCNF